MRTNRRKLRKFLHSKIIQTDLYQEKPWTFVRILVDVSDFKRLPREDVRWSFGFSKVCRPDKWDAEFGISHATNKAVGKLAKQIMEVYKEKKDNGQGTE